VFRRLTRCISRISLPSNLPFSAERTLLLLLLFTVACTATTAPSPTPILEQTVAPASSPSPASNTPIPATTSSLTGVAEGLTTALVTRVIDGDTIIVDIDGVEYRVRYIGIDTPETVAPGQPIECYGKEASERNRDLVEGKTVSLEKDVSETDQFGRLLRYVWVGETMVNAALVADGYALASTYPPDVKHSDLFAALQAEAREDGRGLWAGTCDSPTPVPIDGGCEQSATEEPVIKGNISQSTGERIYHVPGQEFYDRTVIDETAGERWFCTEAEAVQAGWRKSLR
jgi:micrococcal nuclease